VTFYVTFGQKYAREPHPTLAAAHPDGWVEVEADSEMAARRLALDHLDDRWAFMHAEREFTRQLYPRGCIARIDQTGMEAQWTSSS